MAIPTDAIPADAEPARPADPWRDFPTLWRTSTADDNITLYGFRRFKTPHLLNLRFLESEVAELDHKIFQDLVVQLRDLLREYKTRLLRVDQGLRIRHHPLQRWLQKWLRRFQYRSLSREQQDPEKWKTVPMSALYQHTLLIATFVCRIGVALVTAAFLVIPMALLPSASQKGTQILAVSIRAIIFTGFGSLLMRTSNLELMQILAAYAAILSMFISNASICE